MLEIFSFSSVLLVVIGIIQNVKKYIDTDLDYFCCKTFKNEKNIYILRICLGLY